MLRFGEYQKWLYEQNLDNFGKSLDKSLGDDDAYEEHKKILKGLSDDDFNHVTTHVLRTDYWRKQSRGKKIKAMDKLHASTRSNRLKITAAAGRSAA